MRLTERLPVTVEIAGEAYAIRTDFRDILRYDEIIRGQSNGNAVLEAIDMLLGEEVLRKPNMRADDIADAIGWFVKCGDIGKKSSLPRAALGPNNAVPMDFGADSALIYTAFLQTYGLDLYDIPYLHWAGNRSGRWRIFPLRVVCQR